MIYGCRIYVLYSFKGSNGKLGLAPLAMAEILSMAEQLGKSIIISSYEVYQEHVYDLLDRNRPAVSVLEDKGKIQHKGLSQASYTFVFQFIVL